MRVILVFAGLFGCGAEPRASLPTPSINAHEPSVLPRASARVPKPASESLAPILLEPLVAPKTPDPCPKLEILEPAFGEALDAKAYRRVPVRMRTENVALSRDAEGVLISLDGRRPRRLLAGAQLYLEDLLREDEELEEGLHSLLAVAVDREGRALRNASPTGWRALSLVEFFVGTRKGDSAAKVPRLFCLSPVGTHYVSRGVRLLLDVVPLGFSPVSAELRVQSSEGRIAGAFDPRLPQWITGLPLGDVELRVTTQFGVGARCVVTLNPAAVEDGTE